ncbi:MAG: acetate kinase, partial [Acidobacteriales bacterium]|nr:acetate kinase [Terriglobales bacterium]
YAAVLSGIDMLIFSGGIGEHSVRVRTNVCTGLGFLGLEVDARSNELHDFQISTPDSKVRVKVVKSEEDRQIARHCRQMLGASP